MSYRKLVETKNDAHRDKQTGVDFLPTVTVVPPDLKRITNTFNGFSQHFNGWKNLTLNEIDETTLLQEAPEIPLGDRMRAIEVNFECEVGFGYTSPHRIAIIVISDDSMAAYSEIESSQGADRIRDILRDFSVGVAKDPELPRLSDVELQLIQV